MKRRKSSAVYRREKFIRVAGSALVLAAVTVTGVFVYQNSQPKQQEENIVDFSVLEEEDEQPAAEAQNRSVQNYTSGGETGELDYDPYYAAQDELLNQPVQAQNTESRIVAESEDSQAEWEDGQPREVGYGEYTEGELKAVQEQEMASVHENSLEIQEAVANAVLEEQKLHFDENTALQWPVAGNVVLNYSMDKTVYFPTLQQYKYNPSIVISAGLGTNIACAADGIVKSVYLDPQTGGTVVMKLGNGYELTYGQLMDISVEEGEFVQSGVYIGKVGAPTKYYAREGTNVYFKMTKDQEPVNPLEYLG